MSSGTRERIVAAAFRALVDGGYEATSVKDIAKEADVAPGLVHYYFETKEDLVLAALAYGCKDFTQPPGSDPTEYAVQAFAHARSELDAHRDVQRLIFDMVAVGLHNPRVAEKVREFIRSDRGSIEEIARLVLAQRENLGPDRAPAIAAVVWGALWGIALQSLMDGEFDAGSAMETLAEMALGYQPSGLRAATEEIDRDV